ncbi:Clan IH, family I25, phytocystatin-like peptidase inhibitor [Trichomonas vaginalis G3]|uniref:Clan IH, family I25, phytocystatin-like peptidase inhibitor n=1 Tax=Trichomonas vaginalis (strain ATCC PRA-98 / G3) TaxID=412133 RepID=A2E7X2_TRIV3|nr:cystatin family,phytocystatin subfamily [Trichomonas vaginalis G3]EAY11198.1 Clan IH, family I25, phytocystatin-like peptidase inhibitor [Trichomonas vaginalis G3]KAI5551427.1 cystatin family,phytocystatin subfamily [Trichomonas vaginalis G3]|eukprot:XP_001323421.1 Clan IH, family I25, phytocystatin-like peptidase inhibitor [Trichomonas vaginalis G3]
MSCCGGRCGCGGVKPANVDDEHVIQAFKDAVALANQKNGTNLEFVELITATQQVVSGFIFEGVVKTNDGDYKAKIWCKPGNTEKELQSFEKY